MKLIETMRTKDDVMGFRGGQTLQRDREEHEDA